LDRNLDLPRGIITQTASRFFLFINFFAKFFTDLLFLRYFMSIILWVELGGFGGKCPARHSFSFSVKGYGRFSEILVQVEAKAG